MFTHVQPWLCHSILQFETLLLRYSFFYWPFIITIDFTIHFNLKLFYLLITCPLFLFLQNRQTSYNPKLWSCSSSHYFYGTSFNIFRSIEGSHYWWIIIAWFTIYNMCITWVFLFCSNMYLIIFILIIGFMITWSLLLCG